MQIDWNDNTKRKTFREALQEVYPSEADLEMFVDEELNENLAVVAGGDNLRVNAFSLVKWARAQGKIDEVYKAFKGENSSHPVIRELETQPLVSRNSNLTQADWNTLFDQFLPEDFPDLHRAFRRSFNEVFGLDFYRRQQPPLVELNQIREELESNDVDKKGVTLAVRFVEFAMVELKRSSEERDLSGLEQWRDRIAQKFNVPDLDPVPQKKVGCHAYLLVAVEVVGPDVNVYPELRITGREQPIGFGAEPKTCSIDEVADWISEWIHQAEDLLSSDLCDDEEVTLEIFLPCQYLEEDIATTWSVKDSRGREVSLGIHRRFLVRSFDRIRDSKVQRTLERRWRELEDCMQAGNPCASFHLQDFCPPQRGALKVLIEDAVGVKFVAQLPTDLGKRTGLLYDIIDSPVPIVLWSSQEVIPDAGILETEFDNLLRSSYLTNFADLAKQWRKQRLTSNNIRLLCDQPNRFPRLPDLENRENEDAFVAI